MNNVDFIYVVLRNWDNLPHDVKMGEHSDLDLLVYDLDHWKEIFPMAVPQHEYPRVQFKVPVGETFIYVDVRHIGDDYYPSDFECALLDNRIKNPKGFYTPNSVNHMMGLAYHAVHHKNKNKYQRWLGDTGIEELLESLKISDMGWIEPQDPSVGRFNPYWKGATSVVSKEGGFVIKKQTGWKGYKLEENEKNILSKIKSRHFPSVEESEEGLKIEDCGSRLKLKNLPEDWRDQLKFIIQELKHFGIIHRDIKPDNLMVKDGFIKLIDFGWARFEKDKEDSPPSCLGYPYKPSYGFDDNFSMKKIIKEFEYKLEKQLEGSK